MTPVVEGECGVDTARRTPLLGRSAELGWLEGVLRRAAGGAGQVVLVEGEAGIGKSRLLAEVCGRAVRDGWKVRRVEADVVAAYQPFSVATDLFGTPARDVAELVDAVRSDAVGEPLLLAIDDAHLADPASLHLLGSLARRTEDLALAMLVVYRPVPGLRTAAPGFRQCGAQRIGLPGLPGDTLDELVVAMLERMPGRELRGLLDGVAGNPGLAVELVAALDAEGMLESAGGHAEMSHPELPPAAREILLRSARELSPAAQTTLSVGCVLGTGFCVSHLALASGRSTVDLLPVLDELIDAGLFAADDDRLVFRHRLVHKALYDDIPAAVRASLHLDVGRALSETGAPPTEVGRHLALGALPGDKEALTWLRTAARGVRDTAPATSARLLEQALALALPEEPLHGDLMADLAESLAWSGRLREAGELARKQLARRPGQASARRLSGLLANLWRVRGSQADEPDPAPAGPAELAWDLVLADRPGQPLKGTAADRDRPDITPLAACAELGAQTLALLAAGHGQEALDAAERALALQARHDLALWPGHLPAALALLQLDRLDEAETAVAEGQRRAEVSGALLHAPFYRWAHAAASYRRGRWDEAMAAAGEARALAGEVGTPMVAAWADTLAAELAVQRNDLRGAGAALARAEEIAEDLEIWPVWAPLWRVRALVAEANGEPGRALASVARLWEPPGSVAPPFPYLDQMVDLVRLCVACGDERLASRISRRVADFAADPACGPAAGHVAQRCAGLVSRDPETLLSAAWAMREHPAPLARADALADAGAALVGARRAEESVHRLEEALAAYEQMGAARSAAKVRSALRALGVHRRSAARPRRRSRGWGSLTATELDVLRLLSEGLTNREAAARLFISPRTVESHVSHIYAKLGVASRAALMAEAGAHAAELRLDAFVRTCEPEEGW
ncbi:hypothetical protein ACRB68_31040 [Actinomadura sp. RB68]|uniref:HTH luxR-type domain-containing protein n=1 Tax=Actinomadura macrotermitis TaxID=2585200 RepID=A0A7K0BV49_9ACTN|nr:hypothetical protein [Actinomadura macrotermitis]